MRKVKGYLRLFLTMLKIGLFTFGGGYAMIALLENEFVEKKKWLEKDEFLDVAAIAESTPGPIAINASTYIGYKNSSFSSHFFFVTNSFSSKAIIAYPPPKVNNPIFSIVRKSER